MRLEDLGLIGNCQCSALVERTGSIVFACLPRFDSDPVFGALLDAQDGGRFTIGPAAGTPLGVQRYIENTNVLTTTFHTSEGSFRVVDFIPRFELYQRMFRPTQIFRRIEPIDGTPVVSVRCEPRLGWTKAIPARVEGSNHISFAGFASELRLTTDIPRSYLNGQPFALTAPRNVVLTWGAPIEEPLDALSDRFLRETIRYWQKWVKHCNTPPQFQHEVIRSALALKLHCFEDTGAIIAATTCSLPEANGSGRTWDYRYCWLRDSYYTLNAFRLLGHFEERESFIRFLFDVAARHPKLDLAPLYCVDGSLVPEERIERAWPGYEGNGPVRVGNAASLHTQHDVFGEMVLALAPVFIDERFRDERSRTSLELLERLARKAIEVAGTPDAGIWEYRTEWKPQTFSSLMCWAAADRMARVAEEHAPSLVAEMRSAADLIRDQIVEKAWNPKMGAFAATYGGAELDAATLQMGPLRFLPRDDARLSSTIAAIRNGLAKDGWLFRYKLDDGFGTPEVAFVLCTFWLVEALATIGRRDEAHEVMRLAASLPSNGLGLMAEDVDTRTGRMWGNFPQAYSHVGFIHAAFAACPSWAEAL